MAAKGHRENLSQRPGAADHPFDEWTKIEKGLTQRLTALNMFLRDIYHEGEFFPKGLCAELVYS